MSENPTTPSSLLDDIFRDVLHTSFDERREFLDETDFLSWVTQRVDRILSEIESGQWKPRSANDDFQ